MHTTSALTVCMANDVNTEMNGSVIKNEAWQYKIHECQDDQDKDQIEI